MNKRQKKKAVKRALKNMLKFEDSKYDRHVLKTIGTNKKIKKELRSDNIIGSVQDVIDKTVLIFKPIVESYVEAFKVIRKKFIELGEKIAEAEREAEETDDI